MGDKKKQKARRWLFAGFSAAGIYSTLCIVRPVCEFLKTSIPFSFMINGILLFMLAVIVVAFSNQTFHNLLAILPSPDIILPLCKQVIGIRHSVIENKDQEARTVDNRIPNPNNRNLRL